MKPVLFFIGFMGSGKTSTVRELAMRSGADWVDLDAAIEEQESSTIVELIQARGEEAFRELEERALHHFVEEKQVQLVACGGGTPCIAGALNWMKSRGQVIHLNPPFPQLKARLLKAEEQKKRPLLWNDKGHPKSDSDIEALWVSRSSCYSGANEALTAVPGNSDFLRWSRILKNGQDQ